MTAAAASLPTAKPAQGLLEVNGLRKHFRLGGRWFGGASTVVRAVDDVSFTIATGETLGIVGESGCGKSTTARLLMHLVTADAGTIAFDGRTLSELSNAGIRDLRRSMQMVFQDSHSSLNPRLCVEDTVAFGPMVHGMTWRKARERARALLSAVELEPDRFGTSYPHELSGGQRQRVNIARALALEPRLLILDEAVSALDKSVEAQVLSLLLQLKEQLRLTYMFISHDLSVVQYISDRVVVMYLGKVIEVGPVDAIYGAPRHPYTQALLASRPTMNPDRRTLVPPLGGDPPSPIDPPSGCRFRTRCSFAEAACARAEPPLAALAGSAAHLVACHMVSGGAGYIRGVAS